MKKSILFILALLSSSISAFACGYYPYGEDVRMCFFRPQYFNYYWYSQFNYSAAYFDESEMNYTPGEAPNDKFWYSYCKGKVPMPSIKEAMHELTVGNFNAASASLMVKYLYSIKDTEAINYLIFAKECEPVNGWNSDPWERNENNLENERKQLIDKAIGYSKTAKTKIFRQRYAFLAMRMAFYNGKFDVIRNLFDSTFRAESNKDIVYYWALYFYRMTEENRAKAAYYAAQIFANAPDKRFVVFSDFDSKIPLSQVLQYAQNDKERANIYIMAAIKKHDKALEYIKKVYEFDPKNEGLEFLMLREVNKLEDWIYTPYYTLFSPSLEDSYNSGTEAVILKRVEQDRQYAFEVLSFVNAMQLGDIYWLQVRAQLELLAKQYGKCLSTIAGLDKRMKAGNNASRQIDMIYALAMTAYQQEGKAIILDAVKPILLKYKEDQKFIFAIARELEYKGNTTDAALLYANLYDKYSDDTRKWGSIYWKDGKGVNTYDDYYTGWFGYLNFNYTPQQVQLLIDDISKNKVTDAFSKWKYEWITGKVSVLYDLLGTKYMRQNKLEQAVVAFKKAGNQYWVDNYGFWERPSFFGDGHQFDENPFYKLNYTNEFITTHSAETLNKYTVSKQLIYYLKKADDINGKDRDYYYFLVANCYYNMTDYGNSWMMRRFYQSSSESNESLEDNAEYYECNLAKQYYAMAYKTAKTDKFRALCLRMLAMCERTDNNKYYKELKAKYPDYYDDLSFCAFFPSYFAERR